MVKIVHNNINLQFLVLGSQILVDGLRISRWSVIDFRPSRSFPKFVKL
jgi:hypothetical protein